MISNSGTTSNTSLGSPANLLAKAANDAEESAKPLESTAPRQYRMVALDLDGTLLQSSHKMADVQADYLRNLYHQGIAVCIATGRAAPSVYEHVQKLALPTPIPVVCSNGARGMRIDASTLERTELFYNPVPALVVKASVALAKEHGFAVQYYHDDEIFVNSFAPEHLKITARYTQLTGSEVQPIDDDFTSMLSEGKLPSKILILFDESCIQKATQVFQDTMKGGKASVVLGAYDWFLEVLHPKVTKGYGLELMCKEHVQIPLEECIAMGDGANDLEFLKMAGLGLAMKNARPIVQEHADETIEWTNDDHGVMKALQSLEGQGQLAIKK